MPELTRRAVALGLNRWCGVALTLIGVVATLLLAISGRLTLYIHPRYVIFSVVVGLLAAGVAVLVVVLSGGGSDHDHDHGAVRRSSARESAGLLVRSVIVIGAVLALLVVPPSTLSTSLAQDRGLATPTGNQATTGLTLQGDSTSYTIKDWWTLLQAGQPELIAGKAVRVVGQVHDEGSQQQFYVARQLLTCCAVDAQLIGLPVQAPGWRERWQPGQWVEVTGTFVASQGLGGAVPYVIETKALTETNEPRDPYVY